MLYICIKINSFVMKNYKLLFNIILTLSLSIFFTIDLKSQKESNKQKWRQAENLLLQEKYDEAEKIYSQLYAADKQNFNIAYKIGYCYVSSESGQNTDLAVEYLKFASEKTTIKYKNSFKQKKAPVNSWYYLGVAYRLNKDYTRAIDAFRTYESMMSKKEKKSIRGSFLQREIKSCQDAMQSFDERYMKIEKITVEGLKDPHVRCPILCYDAKRLIFTNGKYNIFPPDINWDKDYSEGPFDKVFMADRREDGTFYNPVNIHNDLKIPYPYIPVTATSDGSELYLVVDKYDNGDLWVSKFEDGKYQPAKPVKKLNTKRWESHATITPDGKRIYFTSMRRGGQGGLDIWYSDRDEKGNWTKPVNLGPEINTKYHEEMPYIMRNGQALYFASEGHTNIGGFDMFYSSYDPVTKKWSTPINLKFPFSTSGNDMGYILENTPTFAFCPVNDNKRRPDMGECDCINLVDEKAPMLASLSGFISLDPDLEELKMKMRVKLIDNKTGEEVANVGIDENGNYAFNNIKAGDYKIVAYADDNDLMNINVVVPQDGNWNISNANMTIDTRPFLAQHDTQTQAQTQTQTQTQTTNNLIKNVVFSKNSADILEEFKSDLKVLADYLKSNTKEKIQITGFASKSGNQEYNMNLSRQRAENVKNVLLSYGVNPSQIDISALGWDEALAVNTYPDSRMYNQRAEIKFVNGQAALTPVNVFVPTYYRENKNLNYDKGTFFYSEKQIFTEAVIENIFFDFDKFDIKPEYKQNLDFIASYLKANPTAKIKLTGHTDHYGADEYNIELSRNRVNAVADYLFAKGVTKNQVETDYRGKRENITIQTTDDLIRRLNRRVVVSVIVQGVPPVKVAPIEVPEEYKLK